MVNCCGNPKVGISQKKEKVAIVLRISNGEAHNQKESKCPVNDRTDKGKKNERMKRPFITDILVTLYSS